MKFLLIILFDQFFKFLTFKRNFAVVNKGIAFGLFPKISPPLFIFLICILAILRPHSKFSLPLKLILTGGISNLLDRLRYGGVVDYLHFPLIVSFNLADLVITTGFLLIIVQLFLQKPPK